MTEEVTIVEDETDKSCDNCGVRFGSGKHAMEVGPTQAQNERIPICVRCKFHPNMGLVKSIGGSLVESLVGEIVDNWRPVTDDDKSCSTCVVWHTVNAMRSTDKAHSLIAENCLDCRHGTFGQFSRPKKMISEVRTLAGLNDNPPTGDNWRSFKE